MRFWICFCILLSSNTLTHAQFNQVDWVVSTRHLPWKKANTLSQDLKLKNPNVKIDVETQYQTIEGFGSCFNELGWTSLSLLSPKYLDSAMKELFTPGYGANFTICRMPVGANDFSR